MRSFVFGERNVKEILRDPLSYVFCLGFPLVMLFLMTIVNSSIPENAPMEIFHIASLAPSIAVFGLTFVMLFNSLQVSKDRSTAFINRMYGSPMPTKDYIIGYTLPLVVLSLAQNVITFLVSVIIGAITGYQFHIGNLIVCLILLLPTALLFVAIGMLFGTLFNDKVAPGICSIIISATGMLGGIWMDVDTVGGMMKKVCKALPFYHGVNVARLAIKGQYHNLLASLIVVILYASAIYFVTAWVFRFKMQKDIR